MKADIIIKKPAPHQALHELMIYAERQVPILIHNVKILREKIPFSLKNKILGFLLNHACNQVLEVLVLRMHEGWAILNRELESLNQPTLSNRDADYEDLDKLRNQLIGHRVESIIYAKNNPTEWYSKKYGSTDGVFDLIEKIVCKIVARIRELQVAGLLNSQQVSIRLTAKIQEDEITALLNALRQAGT